MKKILILTILLGSFMFASGNVHLYMCDSGHTDDGSTATFSICMDNDEPVSGFQFSFDGGTSGFSITETSADLGGSGSGEVANQQFTVSAGGNLVLGFSFTGAQIPVGTGVELIQVTGAYSVTGPTVIQPTVDLSNANLTAFSDALADAMTVTQASSQWDAGTSSMLDADLPAQYSLSANYPNPFNPSTTIDYNVENAGNVSIVVYDMMGREVKTLINEYVTPKLGGDYSTRWNGTNNSNAFVATGIYMYRMISNDFIKTSKMTLAK